MPCVARDVGHGAAQPVQLRAGRGDVAADRGADLDLRLQQLAA